jgi:cell division protein FtsI (penicillin-binding protein 3)
LEGYSAAGKTGTAQKVDPSTGTYSKTKYVASFAGFAPVNNPAVTVAVILDSAVGLHQGGQVSAPVFQRVAQQVLEYLHVSHDVDLPNNRQVLLARRNAKDDDLAEASPDHLGSALGIPDNTGQDNAALDSNPVNAAIPQTPAKPSPNLAVAPVVQAALREREAVLSSGPPQRDPDIASPVSSSDIRNPSTGTVVLDVEQGGIVVPSFIGRSVRYSIEMAEEIGLDLDAVGSGLGFDQSPQPGTHVPSGTRIVVRFGR